MQMHVLVGVWCVVSILYLECAYAKYEIVDVDNCNDIMSSLILDSGFGFGGFQIQNSNIVYNENVHIDVISGYTKQPHFFFSTTLEDITDDHVDMTPIIAALLQPYQSNYKQRPNTVLMTMRNHIILQDTKTIEDIDTGTYTNMIKNVDMSGMISDSTKTTYTVKECKGMTFEESGPAMVCVMMLEETGCIYRGFAESIDRRCTGAIEWQLAMTSLFTGMGHLNFKFDMARTIKLAKMDCGHLSIHTSNTSIRGFDVRLCTDQTIVGKCVSNGAACSIPLLHEKLPMFFRSVAAYMEQDPSTFAYTYDVEELEAGYFAINHSYVQFDSLSDAGDNPGDTSMKNGYIRGMYARKCPQGTIPTNKKLLIREPEYEFYNEIECIPCRLNFYYTEENMETVDTFNSKTLYVFQYKPDAYRLVENVSDVSPDNKHWDWYELFVRSIPVLSGTVVRVEFGDTFEFVAMRGPTTATYQVEDDTLIITIAHIHGTDPVEYDDPIFIDMKTSLTDIKTMVVIPVRHHVRQICKSCPAGTISGGYASEGYGSCISVPAALRVASDTMGGDLLDSIGGEQVVEMTVGNPDSSRRFNMDVFVDTYNIPTTQRLTSMKNDFIQWMGIDTRTHLVETTSATVSKNSIGRRLLTEDPASVVVSFDISPYSDSDVCPGWSEDIVEAAQEVVRKHKVTDVDGPTLEGPTDVDASKLHTFLVHADSSTPHGQLCLALVKSARIVYGRSLENAAPARYTTRLSVCVLVVASQLGLLHA